MGQKLSFDTRLRKHPRHM